MVHLRILFTIQTRVPLTLVEHCSAAMKSSLALRDQAPLIRSAHRMETPLAAPQQPSPPATWVVVTDGSTLPELMMEPIGGSTATVCKSPALLLEPALLLSTALNGPLAPREMAGETFSQVESMKSPSMGLHLTQQP